LTSLVPLWSLYESPNFAYISLLELISCIKSTNNTKNTIHMMLVIEESVMNIMVITKYSEQTDGRKKKNP
jgi:hypothetical protein